MGLPWGFAEFIDLRPMASGSTAPLKPHAMNRTHSALWHRPYTLQKPLHPDTPALLTPYTPHPYTCAPLNPALLHPCTPCNPCNPDAQTLLYLDTIHRAPLHHTPYSVHLYTPTPVYPYIYTPLHPTLCLPYNPPPYIVHPTPCPLHPTFPHSHTLESCALHSCTLNPYTHALQEP